MPFVAVAPVDYSMQVAGCLLSLKHDDEAGVVEIRCKSKVRIIGKKAGALDVVVCFYNYKKDDQL